MAVFNYFVNLTRNFPFREIRRGAMAPALVVREPAGVVGAVVPFNGPIMSAAAKIAPALAAGCTDCVQAGTRDAAGCVRAGRSGRGRRRATRGGEHPAGRRHRRGGACHPPGRRSGGLHRQHQGRADDLSGLRRNLQAAHARAGRQGGGRASRRRTDRSVDRVDPADELLQQRTGLHRAHSHSGAPSPLRRGRRRRRRGDAGDDRRRPAGSGNGPRPGHLGTPPGADRGHDRAGPARRKPDRLRGRAAVPPRAGVVRGADGVPRRRQRQLHRAERGVRAGAGHHPARR